MSVDRAEAAVWAIGLGVTTGLIAGPVAGAPAGDARVTVASGVVVVSALVIYALLARNWEYWLDTTPLARFGIYFVSLFVGTMTVAAAGVVLSGPFRLAVTLAGVALAFSVASWLTFLGGLERVLDVVLPYLDL